MKIKTFSFPTFEEWRIQCRNKEVPFSESYTYLQRIGAYRAIIQTTAWGTGKQSDSVLYTAVLEHDNEGKWWIYRETHYSEPLQYEELKNWYESVTEKINEAWKEYILKTYFDETEY